MNLSKSQEILNILAKILKIFAYLLFILAMLGFLFQLLRGPYIPIILFIAFLSFVLIFLLGLIYLNLSNGLFRREKWAWVMGLVIFSYNLIFATLTLILWKKGLSLYGPFTREIAIGGILFSTLFLTLFILSSNLFRGRLEKFSLWFQKKGFLLVFFGFIFLLCISLGTLIYLSWSIKQQVIQEQKEIEKLMQIKIGSTHIPTSKEFIEESTKNWKTYHSKIMGISIKHPPEWLKLTGIGTEPIGECEEKQSRIGDLYYYEGCEITIGKKGEIGVTIRKANYYTEKKLLFKELVEVKERYLKKSPVFLPGLKRGDLRKEEVTVDNILGIRMTSVYKLGDDVRIISWLSLPGKDYLIYEIFASFDAQKQDKYLPLFNLMLSTVEFSPTSLINF